MKVHPVLLQLIGIVLFGVVFGQYGIAGFFLVTLIRYNTLRWKAGWKYGRPDTIFPIWMAKQLPHIAKFYRTGATLGIITMAVLLGLGWKIAAAVYGGTWVTIFVLDQVIAYLYLRRIKRQPSCVFLA